MFSHITSETEKAQYRDDEVCVSISRTTEENPHREDFRNIRPPSERGSNMSFSLSSLVSLVWVCLLKVSMRVGEEKQVDVEGAGFTDLAVTSLAKTSPRDSPRAPSATSMMARIDVLLGRFGFSTIFYSE
jgi:hypothetical protein